MQSLSQQQLYLALAYAKSLDETAGRSLLEQFQQQQPVLAQAIFGIFPIVIAQQNQSLAELFMDLSFDVICVFQHGYGQLPAQSSIDSDWLREQTALIDAELQALMPKMPGQSHNQPHAKPAEVAEINHDDLINFINDSIQVYVDETGCAKDGIEVCRTLISIVIRLLSSLYQHYDLQGLRH